MQGGYVELIDMDGNVKDTIKKAWKDWAEGPATEASDIEEARGDFLEYITDIIRN